MNSAAWNLFLAGLPADQRENFGNIIDRVATVVDEMRNLTLDQLQRIERRQDGLGKRQSEIVDRLDRYEEQRARDVAAEIDRRLADTITREEHDALLTTLFEMTARIAALEPLADFAARVHAAEHRCVELQTQVDALLAQRERGGNGGSHD